MFLFFILIGILVFLKFQVFDLNMYVYIHHCVGSFYLLVNFFPTTRFLEMSPAVYFFILKQINDRHVQCFTACCNSGIQLSNTAPCN